MADLIWDPTDLDKDGVFWDPRIGDDNSPAAEAERAKAQAKKHAQSRQAQKQAEKAQDEAKKKQAQAKRQAESARTAAVSANATSTISPTYLAVGAAALIAIYLLGRR